MSNESSSKVTLSCGGPLFVLFLVFLVLKLTEVITWSWWWVTAPIWIPWGIVLVLLVLAGIVVGLARLVETPQDRARRKAAAGLRAMARRNRK